MVENDEMYVPSQYPLSVSTERDKWIFFETKTRSSTLLACLALDFCFTLPGISSILERGCLPWYYYMSAYGGVQPDRREPGVEYSSIVSVGGGTLPCLDMKWIITVSPV